MANHVEVEINVLRKFALKLAGNEKKIRDIGVKKLRKWMTNRSGGDYGAFTEDDMMKLWKGLHYCMWMSDKPLVQEELADRLANLIDCFEKDLSSAFMFIDTFFKTQAREWSLLDRLRLDKFMMLIRKFLNRSFCLVQSNQWKKKQICRLAEILSSHMISPTNEDVPTGLKLHIADIYMDELEKVGIGELSSEKVQMILEPYCIFLTKERNQLTMRHVMKRVFFRLIDYAMDKQPNSGEEKDVDEETSDTPSGLEVDYSALADRLFELASNKECPAKNRREIYNLVKTFRDLAQGILPQEEDISSGEEPLSKKDIAQAIDRMQHFEAVMNRRKKRNQKRKKKAKRQNANSGGDSDGASDGDSDGDDRPPSKKQKTSQSTSKVTGKGQGQPDKVKCKNKQEKKTGKTDKKKKAEKEISENGEELQGNGSLMFEGGFDDNNNDKDSESSPKKKKQRKKKKAGSVSNSEDSRASVNANSSSANSDETTLKADIVVPSRRGKLKDIVKESFMEKPSVKVVQDEGEEAVENEPSLAKTMARILKFKGSSDDVTESLFSGGFVDSDDDIEEKVAKKKKKKEGKQKRKSLPAKLPSQEESSDVHFEKPSDDHGTSDTVVEGNLTNGKGKKSKKLKRKSTGSIQFEKEMDFDGNNSAAGTKSKTGESKNNKAIENGLDEDEFEILIPNKKYKGKYKESFEKEIEKSMAKKDKNLNKSSDSSSTFASFEKITKTPPAFVRKAVAKATSNKKKSPKGSPTKTPSGAGGNRRVSFGLHKNMEQEFQESLQTSPVVPFDPKITPNQGILKPTALSKTKSPSLGSSPKLNLQKQLAKKRKPRAEDFF